MNGWQRFFLVLVCSLGVLVCWPQYDASGLTFLGFSILLWSCIILVLSVLSNIFGIYHFETLNRLVSLIFLTALLASLLYYFPLENKQTPWMRLQAGQYPSTEDLKQGGLRLKNYFTHNTDTALEESQHVREKLTETVDKLKEQEKSLKKQKEKLDAMADRLEDKR